MSERIYYVICQDNCKFESMTKEQIIAAIAEATGNTPTDVDKAFITKIKEQNTNAAVKIWVGTQAEFNALTEKDPNTLYYYDDTDYAELQAAIEKIISGDTVVGEATHALKADSATKADTADFLSSKEWVAYNGRGSSDWFDIEPNANYMAVIEDYSDTSKRYFTSFASSISGFACADENHYISVSNNSVQAISAVSGGTAGTRFYLKRIS